MIVVDPQPHMTYQPFLPEAAAGNISPRHTVVPLRRELQALPHRLRRGHPDRARPQDRRPCSRSSGRPREIAYDHIIVAPGSVSRTLPIPGLREHGDRLQDHRRGHLPAQPRAGPARRRGRHHRPGRPAGAALTFVFVGGGYAGIEALAEMEDMARDALRYYPELRPGRHALGAGRGDPADPARGRPGHGRVHRASSCSSAASTSGSDTRLESCVDGVVKLSDGDELPRRHHRLDGRRQAVADARPHRPAARRPRAASPACRRCRWSTTTARSSRARGAPATAPRCPT